MSQFDFGTIDPNTKTGPQLALDLNNFRDALNSLHLGDVRPSYARPGMLWVREVSTTQWDLMFYDGDTDFVLRSVNPTANTLINIPSSQIQGLDTAISMSVGKDSSLSTGAAVLPAGTTIQRPVSPTNGMLRYNSSDNTFEGYRSGAWKPVVDNAVWGTITGSISAQSDLNTILTDIQSKQKVTKKFVSGELTMSGSSKLSVPHGFGIRPETLYCEIICKVTEGGWSVGDVVPLSLQILEVSDAARGVQMYSDDINIYAQLSALPIVIANKSTAILFSATFANWRLIVKAYA